MASVPVYAEEVKLTDHDRMEMRQRADSLHSGNMLGRDRVVMSDRMSDRHVEKTKHTKRHHTRRHARRGHN
jgi:hypothetical protein